MNRINFKEDEKKYAWLTILLDTFELLDNAIDKELSNEINTNNKVLACKKGCFNCCINPTVPFTELELRGISWFASEKYNDYTLREKMKQQLLEHASTTRCPFLINGECSIYPVRPIACRQFHVLNKECAENEDVITTRMNDVWLPSRQASKEVAKTLLLFWNIIDEAEKEQAFESGFIVNKTKNMHEYNWRQIKETMDYFDTV